MPLFGLGLLCSCITFLWLRTFPSLVELLQQTPGDAIQPGSLVQRWM